MDNWMNMFREEDGQTQQVRKQSETVKQNETGKQDEAVKQAELEKEEQTRILDEESRLTKEKIHEETRVISSDLAVKIADRINQNTAILPVLPSMPDPEMPAESASKSKIERRRLKRKQEAEQRRQERKLQQEEKKYRAEDEQLHVDEGKWVMTNSGLQKALTGLDQKKGTRRQIFRDTERAYEAGVQGMLQKFPELREKLSPSVQHSEMMAVYRRVILENVEDMEIRERLLERLDFHKRKFDEAEESVLESRAGEFDLQQALGSQISDQPMIQQILEKRSSVSNRKMEKQMQRWTAFEQELAAYFKMPQGMAILGEGSPFHYLDSKQEKKRFEEEVETLQGTTKLTREAAADQIAIQNRKVRTAAASKLINQEEIKKYAKQRNLEGQRLLDEKRQKERNILFSDPVFVKQMGDFAENLSDESKAADLVTVFARTAAQKLMDQIPMLAEANGDETGMAESMIFYQRAISENIFDETKRKELLDRFQVINDKIWKFDSEKVLFKVIESDVMDALQTEIEAQPLIREKLDQISKDFEKEYQAAIQEQLDLEQAVKEALHFPAEKMEKGLFSVEPYAHISKKQESRKFNDDVEALMKSKQISKTDAEKELMEHNRAQNLEKVQQAAIDRSLQGNVVEAAQADAWKRYGGASAHQTVLSEEAQKAVEAGSGFLYAKDLGNGLSELRPTLPAEVTVNGTKCALRQDYILLIRSLVRNMIDEKGQLVPGAQDKMTDITGDLKQLQDLSMPEAERQGIYDRSIRQELTAIVGEQEAGRVIREQVLMGSKATLLPGEILGNVQSAVDRLTTVKKAPLAPMVVSAGAAMMAGRKRIVPTAEELMKIRGIYSLYADADEAVRELLAIRDMDSDSQEVPLPNACSANSVFYHDVSVGLLNRDNARLQYMTRDHTKTDPQMHIDYILAHAEELEEDETAREKLTAKVKAIAEELKKGKGDASVLSEADIDELQKWSIEKNAAAKYIYHEAAQVGQTKDGETYTVEGFAAETRQYMVSPFSLHHAVGKYHGKITIDQKLKVAQSEGMVGYYDRDNPLPSDEDKILAELKEQLAGGTLPGYQEACAQAAGKII